MASVHRQAERDGGALSLSFGDESTFLINQPKASTVYCWLAVSVFTLLAMVGWGLRTMHLTAPMEDPLARALPGLLYFAILVERSCHFSWNSGGVVVFGMAFLPWVALSSFHSEHCYWTHMGQAGLCLLGVYIATPEHRNREQTHFWQPRISSRYADGFILCFFALALTWIMEIAELWSSRDATSPSLLWFALSAAPGIVILLLGLRHILEALLRGNPLQEVCNWAFLQPVYGAAAVVGVVIWLFSLPFLLEHGDSGDWWMFLLMELPVLLGFLVLASMSMISNYLPSQPKSKDLLNDLLPPEWTSTLVRTWESPLLPIFLSLGIIAGIPALVMFGAGGFSKDAWPKHMQTSEFWQQMLFWTYVLSVALVGIGIGAAVLAKSRFRISKITLEDKIAFVLVFVLLGVVGVWLMTDVETYMLKAVAWARPSIPDLDPLEYVKVQIIPPKVEQKEDGLKFIEVPSEGFWPNSTDMESMRAQKADHKRCWFFLPWMAVKYISFVFMFVCILGLKPCCCQGSQGSTREEALKGSIESNYVPLPRTSRASGAEQQAGAEGSFSEVSTPPKADRAKKPKAAASREEFFKFTGFMILRFVIGGQLVLVCKLSVTACRGGQLSADQGMAWEGYDLCLTAGLLWFLAQALALRGMDWSATYNCGDVALATLPLWPFVGAWYDTLKDSMVAALAMSSGDFVISLLGFLSMSWLVFLHMVVWLDKGVKQIQLQKDFLGFFLLHKKMDDNKQLRSVPETDGRCSQLSNKILVVLYEQTTPSRRWGMITEDTPQGLMAVFLAVRAGAVSTFLLILNVAIPAARLIFASLCHDYLAQKVPHWLFREAVLAQRAGNENLCEQFVKGLCRVDNDDFLHRKYVDEDQQKKLGEEAKEALKDSDSIFYSWLRLQEASRELAACKDVQLELDLRQFQVLFHVSDGVYALERHLGLLGGKKPESLLLTIPTREAFLALAATRSAFPSVSKLVLDITSQPSDTSLHQDLEEEHTAANATSKRETVVETDTAILTSGLFLNNFLRKGLMPWAAQDVLELGDIVGKFKNVQQLSITVNSGELNVCNALSKLKKGSLQKVEYLRLVLRSTQTGISEEDVERLFTDFLGHLEHLSHLTLDLSESTFDKAGFSRLLKALNTKLPAGVEKDVRVNRSLYHLSALQEARRTSAEADSPTWRACACP